MLDKEKKLLENIPTSSLPKFIADGTISGGMIPKLGILSLFVYVLFVLYCKIDLC